MDLSDSLEVTGEAAAENKQTADKAVPEKRGGFFSVLSNWLGMSMDKDTAAQSNIDSPASQSTEKVQQQQSLFHTCPFHHTIIVEVNRRTASLAI